MSDQGRIAHKRLEIATALRPRNDTLTGSLSVIRVLSLRTKWSNLNL